MTLAVAPVVSPVDTQLVQATLRTLAYADVFDYALTLTELHHYLIGEAASREGVRAALDAALHTGIVARVGDFYCLPDRTHLAALRAERARYSAPLWGRAQRWGAVIASLPFVRMVAVTGALAMHNVATAHDDIDLLVVTAPGRVWLARALCIGVVRGARRFGVELCPNYVVSAAALVQSPRNLYIAHEVVQTVPLSGHAVYAELRLANHWTRAFLPNAASPLRRSLAVVPTNLNLQRVGELALHGSLGDRIEHWERARKQRKFNREAAHSAAAQLDPDHVKGHFNDHGQRSLVEYERRLQQLSIFNNGSSVIRYP
jgi:hypothetical protein